MKIYCDMDGVLVNFEQGVINLVNKYINNYDFKETDKLGKDIKKLQEARKSEGKNPKEITMADLKETRKKLEERSLATRILKRVNFSAIMRERNFWHDLEPMNNMQFLWDGLHKFNISVNILSSPIKSDRNCVEQKIEWCETHLNPKPDKILIEENKSAFALDDDKTPNILVDDTEKKIIAWKEAGGIPVHYKENPQEALNAISTILNENSTYSLYKNKKLMERINILIQ
jgi:hypothetical protein